MTTTCTHIDVLQVQEVEYDAVPLPDDRRTQGPLDGAGEDGAEAHRHRGDADSLLLGQAELHDFCWKEGGGGAGGRLLRKRERLSRGMKTRQVRDEGNNREGENEKKNLAGKMRNQRECADVVELWPSLIYFPASISLLLDRRG